MNVERAHSGLFSDGDGSSEVLVDWRKSLDAARGARAELRRATSPDEVVFCPAFHWLLVELRRAGHPVGPGAAAGIATVAGLSSHVREHLPVGSIARLMAAPRPGGASARVSGLRFRRLLALRHRSELYGPLLRIVRLLDERLDLPDLARSVYWWGERTRMRWAYEYYESAPNEK